MFSECYDKKLSNDADLKNFDLKIMLTCSIEAILKKIGKFPRKRQWQNYHCNILDTLPNNSTTKKPPTKNLRMAIL